MDKPILIICEHHAAFVEASSRTPRKCVFVSRPDIFHLYPRQSDFALFGEYYRRPDVYDLVIKARERGCREVTL